LLVNPANSTLSFQSTGRGQIMARYRDQWAAIQPEAGFRTATVMANYRVYDAGWDQWHVGLLFFDDKADNQALKQSMIQASTAYTRKIFGTPGTRSRSLYLSAGMSMSYNTLSNQNMQLWFGRQFNQDLVAVDYSLPSGENAIMDKRTFLSLTGGLRWIYVIDNKRIFSSGIALHHLNSPQISLFENSLALQKRLNFYFDAEFPLSATIQQQASVLFSMQNPSFQIIPAYKLKFLINDDDSSMNLGIASRISNGANQVTIDALILQFGLETKSWGARLNYEVNVSSLQQFSSSNGAVEFSLYYLFP
jgi:hypothetical protein